MSIYAGKRSSAHEAGPTAAKATPTGPGKQTLVQQAAAQGVATPSSALPHHDAIQRAFGRHDISNIEAHAGGDAAASAGTMGAAAYATGNHVVLGSGTDLHTVAHEAAHVVQQRGGVQLKGGVGEAGDAHEQHADAVADAVVQGKSAEGLLDGYAAKGGGSAGAAGPVQHKLVIKNGDGDEHVEHHLGAEVDGRDPYVHAVFGLMQTLAGAQAGQISLADHGDGKEVKVNPLAGVALEQATPGFQLLQRVIQSQHVVMVDAWHDEALNRVKDAEIPQAKDPGRGAGSLVAFPWKDLPSSQTYAGDGSIEATATTKEVALGHELIHADHAQRGVWSGDDKTLHHVDTRTGPGDYAVKEESHTVGLGAARPGDITENHLRAQLGQPERATYHAPNMYPHLQAKSAEQQRQAAEALKQQQQKAAEALKQQQQKAAEEFQAQIAEHNAWHKSRQAVWAAQAKAAKASASSSSSSGQTATADKPPGKQ